MTIDLAVEKKVVLSVEELSALRLMIRVDMVYKTQCSIAAACKTSVEKATKDTVNVVTDAAAQAVTSTVSDYVEEWSDLDRPLVRAMELSGLSFGSAKKEQKVAVFLADNTFNKLKDVVLTGFYNAIKTTNIEEGQPTDSGAALGQALMRSRPGVIDAFKMAEVPAQDFKSGLFTFSQPSPKGVLLN